MILERWGQYRCELELKLLVYRGSYRVWGLESKLRTIGLCTGII